MSVAKVEETSKRSAKERMSKNTTKAGRTQKPKSDDSWWSSENFIAYIKSQCKTRKSTLAYFKRCGLTYNEKGEPVVVPR